MLITVRTHHVDITSALKEYAQKRAEKLEKFFHNIQEIIVELNIQENAAESERQVALGTVHVPGTTIRAEEVHADLYASIDLLIDKLEAQLRKHKEKATDHHRKEAKKFKYFNQNNNGHKKDHFDAEADINKHYCPKPIGEEDAADLLQSRGIDFLMFRNAASEEINVIYTLAKDEYGLIQP